jgi:hypothetical protein
MKCSEVTTHNIEYSSDSGVAVTVGGCALHLTCLLNTRKTLCHTALAECDLPARMSRNLFILLSWHCQPHLNSAQHFDAEVRNTWCLCVQRVAGGASWACEPTTRAHGLACLRARMHASHRVVVWARIRSHAYKLTACAIAVTSLGNEAKPKTE